MDNIKEQVAEQIHALFEQGDKDGVLVDEELCITACGEVRYGNCKISFTAKDGITSMMLCPTLIKLSRVAKKQHALDNQSKQAALKEQMERVRGMIDKSYLYLKSVCLAAEDDGEIAYNIAMNEALSQLATLKSQLESE